MFNNAEDKINPVDAYREIEAIGKVLRKSIKHMPRYHRYNEGDRIVNILLDVKIALKLTCKGRNYHLDTDKLYNDLITLGTLIDDCIEDGALLLKGKYTVHEPRMRLIALFKMFPEA